MSQIEQFRLISPDWSAKVVSRTSLSTVFCRMVVFLISLASTFLVSCSSDGEYTFRSPDDALRKYQNYASFLHGETALDTDGLIDALCHWQELSDTVYSYLCRDSLFDGVLASLLTSSRVRYMRSDSSGLNPLTVSAGFMSMMCSLNAWFRHAFSLLK